MKQKTLWRLTGILMVIAIGTTCLVSLTCAEVVWHGYMLNRMYQPEGGPTRFRTDRISLSAAAQIDPKISAYVEVYYHPYVPAAAAAEPYRIYLESAYADFKLNQGTLRVGKGRRQTFGITPSYPNRKTTNYGIVSESFTQDRVQGIQYFFVNERGLDVGISLTTALRLGNRSIGDVTRDSRNVVADLADRDVPHEINENMEISGRIGMAYKSGLKFGITGSTSRLDPSDITFLNTSFTPGGTHSSKTRQRYGAYVTYPIKNYVLQAEWYGAKTSDISHNAWEITAGYEPKGMKPKAYVRYAQVNMGGAPTSSEYTWDKKQISVSFVKPIRPTVWLQLEYEHNMESPPGGTPSKPNDIGFLELFTGF